MRKNLLNAALSMAVLAIAGNANAAVKVTVTPISDEAYRMRKSVSVNIADPIVQEDFEAFEKGTFDNPDWDNRLCSHYSSEAIDPALTHGAQWSGHNVCMGGGAAALYNINPQDLAYLNTPKMDYSGTITVTFLAKALRTAWEEEDENGEMVKWHFKSTTMMVRMGTDDDDDEGPNRIRQLFRLQRRFPADSIRRASAYR